jgi:hypothetical protein
MTGTLGDLGAAIFVRIASGWRPIFGIKLSGLASESLTYIRGS